MAQPTVLPGTKLLILVGDGMSPEVFAAPCGLTTTGIEFSASTNTTLIPDCDDPEAPAWEAKDINGLSATVTGNGVMAVESFAKWNEWFQSAEAKDVQVKLDDASLGHWAGQFILSNLKFGGVRGNKVTVDVTMVNNGAVPWVDNP
ncbi:phage tail tube protein [Bradyrhizobium prioriisuperbiae]|uniref:phage tail tube protein n=1 Tax=Bradyrhizobium prioriisuperbiae TaxID=2854389 RepID=UPI0028E6E212|nr:phage tail tube protein [Bradyrhizobium prioritasuperba]